MSRWWRRKTKEARDAAAELPGARVLVQCRDETAAASTVLASAAVPAGEELLLRHLVFVDAARVPEVLAWSAADGYVPAPERDDDPPAPAGATAVALARVQPVDAVSIARERSAISSLTARLGGRFGSWAVLSADEPGVR